MGDQFDDDEKEAMLDYPIKRNYYLSEINNNKMRLFREGECRPEKCKSACCKIFILNKGDGTDDYTSFFFEKRNNYGDFVVEKSCKHLDDENNKCKLWGTEKFPKVCQQFPNPGDSVYFTVFHECSFRFILKPIQDIKEKNND